MRTGILAIFALAALSGCGSNAATTTPPPAPPPPPPAAVAIVSLDQSAVTLTPPHTATLVATTRDANGTLLTGRTIAWTSTAAAVASVDATGVVTAVTPGSARITATSEGQSASANVTVTAVSAPIATLTLNQTAVSLVPLQTAAFTATARDAGGNLLGGRTITWNSNAAAVATVDNNGTVTAVSAGSATITASGEGINATATVTVNPGVYLGPLGGSGSAFSGKITVTIPAGALTSSTPLTITQTANPLASLLLIAGTAYDLGPAATTFTQPVTIQIGYDPAAVPAGSESQLRLNKLIAGAWTLVTGSTVNTTTHVVSGQVTGLGTFAILRLPPVATLVLTPAPLDLPLGMQVALTATAKDAQGNILSGRTVSYSSSATGVASVNAAGMVQSVTTGTTVITATSEGIQATLAINVRSDPSHRTLDASAEDVFPGHTVCGIGIDQHGYCFGYDANHLGKLGDGTGLTRLHPTAIALNQSLAAIAVSDVTGCAIDLTQQLWCWGDNSDGEFGNGNTSSSLVPIRAATTHHWVDITLGDFETVCGIDTSGGTYCWGLALTAGFASSTTPLRVASDPGFVSLGSASSTMCGVTAAGAVYCWGTGITSPGNNLTPTLVPGLPPVARVAVGNLAACAVTMDRRLFCWGGNTGDGTSSYHFTPVQVTGSWRSVSLSDVSACAITTDYITKCWGLSDYGTIGQGALNQILSPTALPHAPPMAEVVMGGYETCGLGADGTGYCWGSRGLLGDDDPGYSIGPVQVIGAQNAQTVSRGSPTGCDVQASAQLQCWDETVRISIPGVVSNTTGDTVYTRVAGVPLIGPLAVKAVSVGAYQDFACAILNADGHISCWGDNDVGELGNGGSGYSTQAVAISSTRSFTSIATNVDESCAVSTARELFCWGSEDGSAVFSRTPLQVMPGVSWASVMSDNDDFASLCGLDVNGIAYCGNASNGFTRIAGTQHWISAFQAYDFQCALDSAGNAWCSGDNATGNLGDGSTTDRTSMVQVAGGLHFTQLASNGLTSCGLVADGTLYCWGSSLSGSFQDGNPLGYVTTPTLFQTSLRFTSISPALGCGIIADGTVWCWGEEATLGDGQINYRNDPVAMAGPRFVVYEPGSAAMLMALGVVPPTRVAAAMTAPTSLLGNLLRGGTGTAATSCGLQLHLPPHAGREATAMARRAFAKAVATRRQMGGC